MPNTNEDEAYRLDHPDAAFDYSMSLIRRYPIMRRTGQQWAEISRAEDIENIARLRAHVQEKH